MAREVPDRAQRESSSPPAADDRDRPRGGLQGVPAAVLALQQKAGNRAVQRVVNPWNLGPPPPELAPKLEQLSRLQEKLSVLALTLNVYGHAHGDAELKAKLSTDRLAVVSKLEQEPDLPPLFMRLALKLREEIEAIEADIGMGSVPEHWIQSVRPYTRRVMRPDELAQFD